MPSDKKLKRASGVTLGLLLCSMMAVDAAAASCNAYLFPQSVSDVALATVQADRLSILSDEDGCPTDGKKCEGKAYLVRDNQVLVSATQGSYRCIAFFNGQRQTTGWVSTDGLTLVPTKASEGVWADTWKRVQGDALMTIRKRADHYVASGITTYAVQPGNVRIGTANGTLRVTSTPAGAIASFTQNSGDPTSECKVTLKQLGPWLLINDGATDDANSGCGGMGVTFNGLYRRAQHAHGKGPKP
jgi:hypothetical protein